MNNKRRIFKIGVVVFFESLLYDFTSQATFVSEKAQPNNILSSIRLPCPIVIFEISSLFTVVRSKFSTHQKASLMEWSTNGW